MNSKISSDRNIILVNFLITDPDLRRNLIYIKTQIPEGTQNYD